MATGGHSQNAVDSERVFGEAKGKLVDVDGQVSDGRVSVQNLPPDVHRKLLGGLETVGHQVVLAQTGELVDIAVKRLEVVSAPGAADAADMVANCR